MRHVLQVLNLSAVILGHVADTRLAVIGQKYLRELELRLSNDSNSARQEIAQLAEGMRHISLPTNTTTQVLQKISVVPHATRKSHCLHFEQ